MNPILQACAVFLAVFLAAAAAGGAVMPAPALNVAALEAASPLRTAPLPATNSTTWPSLVERSPFVAGRSAFSRNAPAAPELKVRLAGIFKVGKELRASVVVGSETFVVVSGDETPAGAVSSVEPTAVVVGGQRLELFKQ